MAYHTSLDIHNERDGCYAGHLLQGGVSSTTRQALRVQPSAMRAWAKCCLWIWMCTKVSHGVLTEVPAHTLPGLQG